MRGPVPGGHAENRPATVAAQKSHARMRRTGLDDAQD